MYSGLLECPMTTRISKKIDGAYIAQSQGNCAEQVQTYQECFQAAADTLSVSKQHSLVNQTISDPSLPAGCSATVDMQRMVINVFFNRLSTSATKCAAGAEEVAGFAETLVHTSISLNAENATITLRGPDSVWYGVGFGAQSMANTYTIVVDGNGAVTEHKLGDHLAGAALKQSVQVVSSSVQAGERVVVLSRPLSGASSDYYSFSFSSADSTIPMISAIGSTVAFGYHKDKVSHHETSKLHTISASKKCRDKLSLVAILVALFSHSSHSSRTRQHSAILCSHLSLIFN